MPVDRDQPGPHSASRIRLRRLPPPPAFGRQADAVTEGGVENQSTYEAHPQSDRFLDRDAEDAPGEREDDERNGRKLRRRRRNSHTEQQIGRRDEERRKVRSCREPAEARSRHRHRSRGISEGQGHQRTGVAYCPVRFTTTVRGTWQRPVGVVVGRRLPEARSQRRDLACPVFPCASLRLRSCWPLVPTADSSTWRQ